MKQDVVQTSPTDGSYPPATNKGSTSNSSVLKVCFKGSPIHNGDITDEERSKLFVRNLASPETSINSEKWYGALSMANAKVYWGLEHVNIKFGAPKDNPIQPDKYKPGGIKVFQGVDDLDHEMLPGAGIPNICTPISIDPPVARGVGGTKDPTAPLSIELYKKASVQNKVGPGQSFLPDAKGAIPVSSDNSILQLGKPLGKYALGKSSYVEPAGPPLHFSSADWDKESGAT